MHSGQTRDQSNQTLPGDPDSYLGIIVRAAEKPQKTPGPLFALLLLGLAFLPSGGDLQMALALWFFFLFDWAFLAFLPHLKRSFGPPKSAALLLAILRLPWALLASPWGLLLQILGTGLIIYGFGIEPLRLQVSHQQLVTRKFPAGSTLRLLHIGDLHMERIRPLERVLIIKVRELRQDIIVFSGDIQGYSTTYHPGSQAQAKEILAGLTAPLGFYIVAGTPLVDPPEVVSQIVEGLPIHWLQDENASFDLDRLSFDLIGLSCTHDPKRDGEKLRSVLKENPERFTILLYHTPDLAPQASDAGIDLQLSGHTHGGQVRLPIYGALITSSIYGKRFESGRYQVADLALYVTRGIGLEGKGAPRVRILCHPEITLWDISGPPGKD